MTIHFASVAAADDLLKTLTAATNGGNGYLDALWQLFLYKGQLYEVVSKGAAAFAGLPIAFWVINHWRNKGAGAEDPRLDTGDIVRYLIMAVLLTGLFNPSGTSIFLYDSKTVAFSNAANITDVARKITQDPVTWMASASAAERSYGEGLALCNKDADPAKRDQCIQNAKTAAAADKILQAGQKFLTGGYLGLLSELVPDPLQTFTTGLMITIGAAFLLLMEVAQLLFCLFLPYVLLIAIADYSVLWGWVKGFITASLIPVAYNLCIISISFAMIQTNLIDTYLWAIIVGLGAPILSIEMVAGSRFGILQGMASVAGKVVGAAR